MVALSPSGLRLIELASQARRAVADLVEAIERVEAMAEPVPTVHRIEAPSADEACAYLDRLPTVKAKPKPSKADQHQQRPSRRVVGSQASAILATLTGLGTGWHTARDVADASPGTTVAYALNALTRHVAAGRVERRPTIQPHYARHEFRARVGNLIPT